MTPAIKNHKANSLEAPAIKSTQTAFNSERTADLEQETTISHPDEKIEVRGTNIISLQVRAV